MRRGRLTRQILLRSFIMIAACGAPCDAQNSIEARAQARLAWMREHQTGMWNVAPSEGAFLRDEVVKIKAKRALEIGTSNGYSGIWIALGLGKTGGHLTTLEIDEGRARLAGENFRAAGVESLVMLKLGDAREEIPKLAGPFEFVFIDADKQDYVRYLQMVLPMVPPGGVIAAHNVTDLRSLLEDFIQAVKTNPQLSTTFVNAGPGGFSVSVKLPPP
jgi:caffeoyl-CoA O-methyltransferase